MGLSTLIVVPLLGTWIEINTIDLMYKNCTNVVPLLGTWIEIGDYTSKFTTLRRRSLIGNVD